jgi:hypothetical protein
MIRLYILWDLEFSFQLNFVLCSCSLFIRGLACSTVAFYVGLYSSHQKKNDAQYGFCKHVKNLCFQNIGMTCFFMLKRTYILQIKRFLLNFRSKGQGLFFVVLSAIALSMLIVSILSLPLHRKHFTEKKGSTTILS